MTTKRKVVYAVESGDYSDYRVHALFEHKADATAAARRVGGEVVAREVYESDPPRVPYYVIESVPGQSTPQAPEMRTVVLEDWDGPYWEGRMVRGVAFHQWRVRSKPAVRVWGTSKEGVRRRWQEYDQQREAEEAGIAPETLLTVEIEA